MRAVWLDRQRVIGMALQPYSYRDDKTVPAFADDKPIIIFDGHCVLCSRSARFVIRHDPASRYRMLAAQTPLGRALYAHYGLDPAHLETNILIADGVAWFKSESTIRILEGLGWPWTCARVLRLLPRQLRDKGYELLAANRFRLFGRSETCLLPTPDIASRFLK